MTQTPAFEESMANLIMSANMEGLEVSETMQAMYVSILDGTASLADCLAQINAKYQEV
ncbi:hypothetical protein RFF05_12615 [Bengtsoniella intestinalis]|uniref:hypothetical protein n=1 Tax=Bengtsoniella intestinalis TaxID=3073143 RepID=UPI00391EF6A3